MALLYEWEWDPSHHPLPLTPAFGSVYPRWMEEALRVTFAEFGLLAAGLDARLHDGYLFTRVKPAGLAAIPPPWLLRPALRLWWLHPAIAGRVRRSVRRVRSDHSIALLRRWETEWRPVILAQQCWLRAVALAGLTDAALADHLARVIAYTRRWVIVHFLLHGAISVPLTQLERFLEETGAGSPHLRVADLVQGSSGASSAPARALSGVGASLRGRAELLDRAAGVPPTDALALLREASPHFAAALDRYLDRFGHSGAGRYEFVVPALSERPAALVPALLRAATAPDPTGGDPQQVTRLIEETVARLADPVLEQRFRRLVHAARRAYAVRDDNVQITFADAFGLGRLALIEAGRRLERSAALGERADIFFLTIPEVDAALRGALDISPEAPRRRRRRWQTAIAEPPARGLGRRIPLIDFAGLPAEARDLNAGFIRYMREIMAAPDLDSGIPASGTEIWGVGAVRGRYTGTARVLRGEEEFDRLTPGDVLVCAITSPAWAPVLPLAGALVTDHGGVLSHPAVIAREFGIPAVVATRRATALIPDGAVVEVDGDQGLVRVLSRP